MKKTRKLISLLMALAMIFALAIPAFAADYSITIANSVENETYSFYKIFDAVYDSGNSATTYYIKETDTWYTYVSESNSPFTLSATADSEGRYQVTTESSASEITTWIASIIEAESIEATKTANGNGGELNVDLDSAGYYYISTTTGTTVTLDTANPTATVIDKNTSSGGLAKTVDDTTVALGDTVKYTVTANVPLYSNGTSSDSTVDSYKITDTLGDGLALDTSSVEVTIYDGTGTATSINMASCVTTENNTITVTWNPSEIDSYPVNATIKITYSATVLSTATNENMSNQAAFGEETEKVDLKTFDFTLNKTNGSETLNGAQFILTEKNRGEIYVVETADGNYRVATYETDEYGTITEYENGATTVITAGAVNIFGLDAGTYTLTEVKAPDGYNQLKGTVTITIDENGNVTLDNSADNDGNGSAKDKTVTIVNNAGAELPSTGGMGTTLFYIFGGALVLCAVVLLVTRRRMDNEQ